MDCKYVSRQKLARNTIKKIGSPWLSKTSDFCFVIRLGFAKVWCFTEDSGALLVLLVLVKGLIYNVISVFIVVWVNGKTLDFA